MDVQLVLERHGINLSADALEGVTERLDHDEIEKAVLYYDSMEAQTDAAYWEIEDQLIAAGLIPATNGKKCTPPEEDENENDTGNEDET